MQPYPLVRHVDKYASQSSFVFVVDGAVLQVLSIHFSGLVGS